MIDLHAHILPGFDDGAEDMYDTLEMASMAVESGVTAIVATPHCNVPGEFQNYYSDQYVKVFREVEKALAKERIPLTLYAGMEVFVTPNLPQLLTEGKILTINGGHYMLMEFAFEEDPDYVNQMLDVISGLGLKPVIAHPERYRFVQHNLQLVYNWWKKGYVIQCNKGSFLGRFGDRCAYAAHDLLQHDLVSVIASDAHSPIQRTPFMLDAYEDLLGGYDTSYLDILFEENPARICKDEPVIQLEALPFY